MRLYVIRHADPDLTADRLTPQGEREADALATRLAAERIDQLYCSVTGRSLATAERVAKHTGLAVTQARWLNEPGYLRVEQAGRTYMIWDTFGETVRGLSPLPAREEWLRTPPFDAPAISSMWAEFTARCDELTAAHGYVREGARYRIEHASDARIAIVAHNGTVLLFLAHLLALPLPLVWCGFYAWPASVTTIHFEEHSDAWAVPRALCVADTSHLRAAGLEPQPRGMGAGLYEPYR
ncbi:MAG: phosphoglycerate mutase family protein [Spirochaetes bacterium]|nr:phosphoglycerate mutase family protein [Spirochaetota bacterium]